MRTVALEIVAINNRDRNVRAIVGDGKQALGFVLATDRNQEPQFVSATLTSLVGTSKSYTELGVTMDW